jgi:hypothetical protein
MSREFVEQCRKEWKRLGVPPAVAEEMAVDLEADLSEAAGEGASAEQVLGNGAFDARTFAASWASARGLVRPGARLLSGTAQLWGLVASTAVSVFMILVGLAALASGSADAFAVAVVRRPAGVPFSGPPGGTRRFAEVGPVPAQVSVAHGPLHLGGFFLLALGLIGLALSIYLWLRWKPLSAARHRFRPDDGMSLPSYL